MKIRSSQFRVFILYIIIFYTLNKNLWDWLSGGMAKGIYYVLIAVGAFLGMKKIMFRRNTQLIFFSFLLYTAVIIANGLSLSSSEQFQVGVIQYLTYPLSFFALFYFMKDHKEYGRLFHWLIGWSGITSVLAIYEFIVQRSVLPDYRGRIYRFANGSVSYRSTVFIGSPLMLGVVLAAVLIIAIYYYHREKDHKMLLVIVLDFAGLLCTGSRGPLVCCIIGTVIMYYYFFRQNSISKTVFIFLICFSCVVICMLLVVILVPHISTGIEVVDFMIYRVASTFDFSSEWGNVERLNRWAYYVKEFMEKPLTGHGLAASSASVSTNIRVTSHGVTTESGVLARFVETGILGAVTYYYFLYRCMVSGLKGRIKIFGASSAEDTLLFVAGIIGLLLVEDIILQISLDMFCTFIMWFVLAYAVNLGCGSAVRSPKAKGRQRNQG